MENSQPNNIKLEQQELEDLLDKGVEFEVKKRKFLIKKPYLGTLDLMSDLALKIAYEDEIISGENGANYAREVITNASKGYALLVAIVVLNSKWKIKLFSKILAKWFYWNMKANDLKKLAQIVLEDDSVINFLISIRLISGLKRTTKPNQIEQNKQA